MQIIKEFLKSGENKGAILADSYEGKMIYTAVTATISKDYKTLKGAEKLMKKYGYETIKEN